MRGWTLAGLWTLMSAALLRADDPLWRLAFEDDFERAEVGETWRLASGRGSLVDGRLFLDGAGGTILVNRPFAADVRIEFEAEANPETTPCDISVAFGAGGLGRYHYLLQFGGRNNQANQISGGAQQVDLHPPFLIEHGQRYRCVATKEGPRLTYEVNGTKILDATVEDMVGGAGFDRVGLVTWNGMYVDRVRVYERTSPAPGGPVVLTALPDLGYRWENRRLSYPGAASAGIERGIASYNARRYEEAIRAFESESPPTLASVAGLAYVIGDVGYDETPADQQRLAELAARVASAATGDANARDFARAAEWFSRITLRSRDLKSCTRLIEIGPEHNPFYHKAFFFRTRFHMASAKEGGDPKRIQQAVERFNTLKRTWPEHPSLREFTGERVPWGEDLIRPESDGPPWARHLQEAFARQQAILNWWATTRQTPDGQLGGGWGDDVEILRGWVPAACISTACETAIGAIERLAQGVWDHVLEDGYDPGIGDVEHSAEPSADALPTMILLRYGDPRWVEYNLRSAKTIRERFMANNERGFLQFRSAEFGAGGVATVSGAAGDTGYHARAMKHHIWLAWYGLPEAREQFAAWCDTWRDVTMRPIGNKPAGFAPASIFYPSGGIDPPTGKPWYDERSNYYGFPGLQNMVYGSLLTANLLTGERRFLEPFCAMMDLATVGPLRRQNAALPPDHPDNLLAMIAHAPSADLTSVYAWLTGERVYDEYTLRHCTPTQRYRIDRDLVRYGEAFEGIARGLRDNWTQHTTEVIQTDRAGLSGSVEVLGAYTGAVCSFRDMNAPTLAVTWDTPDLNFAAVVTEATPQRLRVRLYSFHEGETRIGLRPWQLVPGQYVLNAGEPVPGEQPIQKRYTWGPAIEVEHRHRGTPVWISVPPHREWVVDLRLSRAIDRPAALPDLAIAGRDLKLDGSRLLATVHNIGSAAAGAFDVAAETKAADGWKEVGRARVEGLPAIGNLEPSRQEFAIDLSAGVAGPEPLRVRLDPAGKVDELYELNNAAVAPGE